MLGRCIFEIPVYRCRIKQHTDETNRERKHYIDDALELCPVASDIRERTYENAKNLYDLQKWYPWRYNEVIAWIRLYQDGTRILGQPWSIRAKRIRRNWAKKKFYCGTYNIIELTFRHGDSSNKILETICSELRGLSSMKFFKRRYIDLELLETVGAYIDWRQLLGFGPD